MIYVYKCEECGIINSDEKAFNPRTSIECECGNNANRVFTCSLYTSDDTDEQYSVNRGCTCSYEQNKSKIP